MLGGFVKMQTDLKVQIMSCTEDQTQWVMSVRGM